jgi:hypothetical protein
VNSQRESRHDPFVQLSGRSVCSVLYPSIRFFWFYFSKADPGFSFSSHFVSFVVFILPYHRFILTESEGQGRRAMRRSLDLSPRQRATTRESTGGRRQLGVGGFGRGGGACRPHPLFSMSGRERERSGRGGRGRVFHGEAATEETTGPRRREELAAPVGRVRLLLLFYIS